MPLNILFDLDGTLTDSRPGILACIRHALVGMDAVCPDDTELQQYIGPPLHESFGALLGAGNDDRVLRAIALYRERFTVTGMFENAVYPGIPDVLTLIRNSGATLYVATSKPRVFAQKVLEHFDLAHFFKAIHGSELDGTRSHKDDLIRHVLAAESLPAPITTMIGDRRHDMLGARTYGVRPVGVLWGYGSRDELLFAGAATVCETPSDLPGVLGVTRKLSHAG